MSWRFGLALACTAFGAEKAHSESISACRQIESVLERLECYDRIVVEEVPIENESVSDTPSNEIASAEEKASDLSNWERRSEKDPISDRQNISFFADPNEPQFNQFGGPQTVFLQMRCFDNTTAVVVYFDDFQTQDRVRVAIRLDDQPPTETNWSLASNRQAIGLWNGSSAISFIRSLKGVNKITFRIFLDDGAETYQFESGRINEYATELSTACNWEF